MKQIYILFILLLLISGLSLAAQAVEEPNIRILLSVHSMDETLTDSLKSVISESVSLELILQNFDVLAESETDRKNLLKMSRKSRSSYLLEVLYTVEEDSVDIHMECLRVNDALSLYADSFISPIDLKLDESIEKEVNLLASLIQADVEENPRFVTFLVYDETPGEEIRPEEPGDDRKSFLLSGAFGLFIPAGEAAGYYDMGYVPEILICYNWELPFASLGLGVSVSDTIVNSEGGENSAANHLISFGPEIRMVRNVSGRFSAYASLGGYATFMMVNRNEEGYLGVLIPGASGGIGLSYQAGDSFGISIGTDYSIYFEESLNITGILPVLGVYWNL